MLVDLDKKFKIVEEVLFADFIYRKGSYYQAERIARDHYTKMGYFVLYCPSLNDLLSGNLGYDKLFRGEEFLRNYRRAMDILSRKCNILTYIDSMFRGFPDLIVFDLERNDFFLVETKRNDRLMYNQAIFFILVKEIFGICDIKLVRIKPNGSHVRKRRPLVFSLRNSIELYLREYNMRMKHEVNRYKKMDKEEISDLKNSLKKLKSQKRFLDQTFYDDRVSKIRSRIEFLKNVEYSTVHRAANILDMWIRMDHVRLKEKSLRKMHRRMLCRRSSSHDHSAYRKRAVRGRHGQLDKKAKPYLRLRFTG